MIEEMKVTGTNFRENKMTVLIMKGLLLAFCCSIFLFFLLAILLTYTSVTETYIQLFIFCISIISIFLSAYIICKKLKSNGWFLGGSIGILYAFILILVNLNFVTKNLSDNKPIFWTLFLSSLIGAIGGIVSINIKNNRNLK